MTFRKFQSLYHAVLDAVILIVEYIPRHVGEVTEGRERKETSIIDKASGKVRIVTHNPSLGVHADFDSAHIKCPFDAGTKDAEKDRYHHTTVDCGSITASRLHDGVEIFAVTRGGNGKFQPAEKLEFDTLCPTVPDVMVEEYLKDRHDFELADDELNKATKQAKERGLIEKGSRREASGETRYRIDNMRKTFNLAGLPKNERFAWAKDYPKDDIGNALLLARIAELHEYSNGLVGWWTTTMNLGKVSNVQAFRILDAGLVEAGLATCEVGEKNDPAYVSPERYAVLEAAGKVETTVDVEGEKKVGRCIATA